MSIRQFNATYVSEEDRVLFRLTTLSGEEYRLWLTRFRVSEILAMGEKAAVVKVAQVEVNLLPQQAQAVAEFKQQTAKQSTQFTEFQPAQRLPLGAEPLLVKGLKMEVQEQSVVLHMEVSAGRVLSLKLNDDMVSKLRILLEKISENARWQIQPNSGAVIENAPEPVQIEPGTPGGTKLLH
ncbi:hypothetical protein [Limnohabitans sp. Jir61]|uniref:hypothetical protein n=1 Tax=Limnohabitans sp. Jir61 TaxID=1826168 RepID=UPI0011B21390|nr:hypothetical protein [Limnohabitans sp. Jir61]